MLSPDLPVGLGQELIMACEWALNTQLSARGDPADYHTGGCSTCDIGEGERIPIFHLRGRPSLPGLTIIAQTLLEVGYGAHPWAEGQVMLGPACLLPEYPFP